MKRGKETNESSFRGQQQGITGLETAVVLIAFVVVSSVFAFAALTTGLFSSDASRETSLAGLRGARSALVVRGAIIAEDTDTNGSMDKICFQVANAVGGEAIDLTPGKTIVRYSDASQEVVFDTPAMLLVTPVGDADSDYVVESGEVFEVTLLDMETHLSAKLSKSTTFVIELLPSSGPATKFEQTTPPFIEKYNALDLGPTNGAASANSPTATPVPVTFAVGSYTGDGVDGNGITGLGFQPDVVLVKADAASVPVIRTSSMGGDASKPLQKVALAADLVQSLDADGFTVGADARVNSSGVVYHWTAFKATAGEMVVGSYAGNGSSQSLTGLGFQPEAVVVIPATADEANLKTSAMPVSLAMQFDDDDGKTNRITSIDADGFTVGGGGQTGENGRTYHYVAWNAVAGKMEVGSYSGDGVDDRAITGIGFQPKLVIVKADEETEAVQHSDSLGAASDSTLSFLAQAKFTNAIQALSADGFQVGTSDTVNAASTTHYWVAFSSGQ